MELGPGDGDVVVAGTLSRAVRAEQLRARWSFRLVPDAFEGGGSWVAPRAAGRPYVARGRSANASRSMREAGRRARAELRRYAVANRCDRLVTLTYAEACVDRDRFVADLHAFWLGLRTALGGEAFPYVWVPEWHKSHGLHAHAAIAQYVPHALIKSVWGKGIVDIRLKAGMPMGRNPGVVAERARICARYLAKYIGKDFDDARRVLGRHRYDVAQGFAPREVKLSGDTRDEVFAQACELMNGPAESLWFSPEDAEFTAIWASWRAA